MARARRMRGPFNRSHVPSLVWCGLKMTWEGITLLHSLDGGKKGHVEGPNGNTEQHSREYSEDISVATSDTWWGA